MNRSIRSLIAAVIAVALAACAYAPEPETGPRTQHELLDQLDAQRLAWTKVGAKEYSFTIRKQCDCPADSQTPVPVVVGAAAASSKSKLSPQTASAAPVSSMEAYFSDLRQAIVRNQVASVVYNPTYGFPQQVQVQNNLVNSASQISVYTDDFKLRQLATAPSGYNFLTGVLVPSPVSGFADASPWVVDDAGKWNQVKATGAAVAPLAAMPLGTRVQATGVWGTGGIDGFGVFIIAQINQVAAISSPGLLTGLLTYDFSADPNVTVYEFYVLDDFGVRTPLSVPTQLFAQILGYQQRRVQVNGIWTTPSGAVAAQFKAENITTLSGDLVEITGTLRGNPALLLPIIPPADEPQFILADDVGRISKVRLPPSLITLGNSLIGSRVRLLASLLRIDAYSQNTYEARSLSELRNSFTDIQISGQVTGVFPASGAHTSDLYYLQPSSGGVIAVRVPVTMRNSADPVLT